MKQPLTILLLIIGASAAGSCAHRAASQQTLQSSTSPVSSPSTFVEPSTQTTNDKAPEKAICSLTAEQLPDVNGLRLGLTAEHVLALFPGSNEDAELRSSLSKPPSPFGVTNFIIKPDRYKSKEKFKGINQITFTLLDGHVLSFSIGYDGPEWPHVDKFVEKFSEGKNLPPADAWESYAGMETQLKTLKCMDAEIRIFAGGPGGNLNYVLVRDVAADRKLKERRAKAREKAAQESKPEPSAGP